MNAIGKILNGGFGVFFSAAIILSVLSLIPDISKSVGSLPLGILLAALLVVSAYIISAQYSRAERFFERKTAASEAGANKIFCIFALILLICQITFVLSGKFIPKNDLSYICTSARNLIEGKNIHSGLPECHSHYLEVYPNNHLLFAFIYYAYKIELALTGEISNALPIIINIIGLDVSYILMYKTAQIIYSPEKVLTCAAKGLLFTPLVTYSTFFYTDAVSMPWLTAALYFYIKWRNQDYRRSNISELIFSAFLLAIAYKLKGNAAIFIPAVGIDIFFNCKAKSRRLISFAAFIIVFTSLCVLLGEACESLIGITPEASEKYKFPMIHWIMMSADKHGGYQSEDFLYTQSFDGYQNKINADIERLGQKIHEQGAAGFIGHLTDKLCYTWRNCTFMAGYYNNQSFLKSKAFHIISALCHFTLMSGISRSYLLKIKSRNDVSSNEFVLKLMLAGLTGFLLIWETRCRYLVNFFALFALI